ncbi:hypothetical protein D3OALGA1CA_4751 [Olavius algarvensis associated proteobacterium Delta 3]|nr:hypothetical protein D3OALGB2SA_2025 [Olavius algarvensis associated proteobacterium Delta 3]CAB5156329.1 hypothetical protein D3OALGA1CA_4751 [Olavius algarvensis associated proteobacterium Delta 3]
MKGGDVAQFFQRIIIVLVWWANMSIPVAPLSGISASLQILF